MKKKMKTTLLLTLTLIMAAESSSVLHLVLERHPNRRVDLVQMKEMDRVRHAQLFDDAYINFTLEGSPNVYANGFYYTRIGLGTPPREFFVMVDTGSSPLWVTCKGSISGGSVFDPSSSSTCTTTPGCPAPCSYNRSYGLGQSFVSGKFYMDTMQFPVALDDTQSAIFPTTIWFGCSNVKAGLIKELDGVVDGILGLSSDDSSVLSQLASKGAAPRAFFHCLKGPNDGGMLAFGKTLELGLVYTPMAITEKALYQVEMQSISVNGKRLNVDSSVFSAEFGTVVDSGTALAFLTQEAYHPLITAISSCVPTIIERVVRNGYICFLTNGRAVAFPTLTLNFAGDASMEMKPQEYLLQFNDTAASGLCIGWQEGKGVSILGDLVLRNRIVDYDIENRKLGWKSSNCTLPLKVSTDVSASAHCIGRDLLHNIALTLMLTVVGFI